MMNKTLTYVILGALGALLLALFVHSTRVNAVREAHAREIIDSALAANKRVNSYVATLKQESAHIQLGADSARQEAQLAKAGVQRAEQKKVLIPIPTVTDSANHHWEVLYWADEEILVPMRQQVLALEKDTTRQGERLILAGLVMDSLQSVNSRLNIAAQTTIKDCRVLGPIPCPSRTVVALLSAGLGVYLVRR